jgi:chaperonin GroEL
MPSLDKVSLEGDAATGVRILRRALEEPMRMISSNAGLDGAVVIEKVRMLHQDKNKLTTGYDVIANDYVDMLNAGIIDPVKVTRSAVENAASIAAMILTTSALVADIPEEKPAMPAGGGGGMGMDM